MLGKTTKEREGVQQDRPTSATAGSELSVISKEMRIEGDCRTSGRLRIEGTISGSVVAGGVELVASGTVEGDISATDGIKNGTAFIIGGTVQGAVRAARVEVRKGGSIHGGLEADEAIVQGAVHGGVQARGRLALEETAVVEGDVYAKRLSLEEGGKVNGNIRMGDGTGKGSADSAGKPEKGAAPEGKTEAQQLARATS